MPTKKISHYISKAYEYFKAYKNLLSSSCFCGQTLSISSSKPGWCCR